MDTTYTYAPGYNSETICPLIGTISQMNGTVLTYAYDDAGNIESVTWQIPAAGGGDPQTVVVSYQYDALNRLVRANDPSDATVTGGTTWIYAYDLSGNMTEKACYPYTTGTPGTAVETIQYSYTNSGWKDQMTGYGNNTVTYDNIGNPLSDGAWTYNWQHGRELKQMQKTGQGETVGFVYNEEGLRVQKNSSVTGTTNYVLHGKNIMHMTKGNDQLHFFHDAEGRPALVSWNGTTYIYMYDLQGDVTALLDSGGNAVVTYTYDAWGKILNKGGTLAATLGTLQSASVHAVQRGCEP